MARATAPVVSAAPVPTPFKYKAPRFSQKIMDGKTVHFENANYNYPNRIADWVPRFSHKQYSIDAMAKNHVVQAKRYA